MISCKHLCDVVSYSPVLSAYGRDDNVLLKVVSTPRLASRIPRSRSRNSHSDSPSRRPPRPRTAIDAQARLRATLRPRHRRRRRDGDRGSHSERRSRRRHRRGFAFLELSDLGGCDTGGKRTGDLDGGGRARGGWGVAWEAIEGVRSRQELGSAVLVSSAPATKELRHVPLPS